MTYSRSFLYRILRCLLCFVFCLPGFVKADDYPARPSPARLVNDLANTMSADEAGLLERKLVAYDDSTSNQIAILTIKSIGGHDIAEYATTVFNNWQIGTKKHDNGILIFAAMEDHKLWIVTGKGLEGAVPDITAKHIIEQELTPAFKEQNYYQGFDRTTTALFQAIKGEYKADPGNGAPHGVNPVAIIVVILIVVWIISRISGGNGGGTYMSRRGGLGGFGAGFLAGSILDSFGSRGGGGWGGGDSGGGGFGGFGGGSSGGGGAGGSW